MKTISFDIPFPPTVNHYYIKTGRRFILSKKYHDFICETKLKWIEAGKPSVANNEAVILLIELNARDKRRYDADNRIKAVQDAMTKIGVWQDDSQVVLTCAVKSHPVRGGSATVFIKPFTKDTYEKVKKLWN